MTKGFLVSSKPNFMVKAGHYLQILSYVSMLQTLQSYLLYYKI